MFQMGMDFLHNDDVKPKHATKKLGIDIGEESRHGTTRHDLIMLHVLPTIRSFRTSSLDKPHRLLSLSWYKVRASGGHTRSRGQHLVIDTSHRRLIIVKQLCSHDSLLRILSYLSRFSCYSVSECVNFMSRILPCTKARHARIFQNVSQYLLWNDIFNFQKQMKILLASLFGLHLYILLQNDIKEPILIYRSKQRQPTQQSSNVILLQSHHHITLTSQSVYNSMSQWSRTLHTFFGSNHKLNPKFSVMTFILLSSIPKALRWTCGPMTVTQCIENRIFHRIMSRLLLLVPLVC